MGGGLCYLCLLLTFPFKYDVKHLEPLKENVITCTEVVGTDSIFVSCISIFWGTEFHYLKHSASRYQFFPGESYCEE